MERKIFKIVLLVTILLSIVSAAGRLFLKSVEKSIDNQNKMLCESAKTSGNDEYLTKCFCYYVTDDIECVRYLMDKELPETPQNDPESSFVEERPNTQDEEENNEWDGVALFTAYNSTVAQCGKSDEITASGSPAKINHTIACPPDYEFGTKIEIDGVGVRVCEDRGGAIKGEHFDIFFGDESTLAEAYAWGEQYRQYRIIN